MEQNRNREDSYSVRVCDFRNMKGGIAEADFCTERREVSIRRQNRFISA